jgi:hypothetical protein
MKGHLTALGLDPGDVPSFVEMARAVVAIGVTKRLLVACQDYEYLFAQIER